MDRSGAIKCSRNSSEKLKCCSPVAFPTWYALRVSGLILYILFVVVVDVLIGNSIVRVILRTISNFNSIRCDDCIKTYNIMNDS